MHEENFLSSWLREDVEGIEEGRTDRKRLERMKAGVVKRKVERSFEELSLVEDLGGFGNILVEKC